MSEKEFKKLLIDLDLTLTSISAATGLSISGVRKYFRNELRNEQRRADIKRIMLRAASTRGVHVPEFWTELRS